MKVRIIPTILIRNFGVVKTVGFDVYRPLGVATNFARVYNSRGVDELIVLDIDATGEGRGPDYEYVRDISEECFMPLTVGGGITSLDEVKLLIQNGADKISINTAAIRNPDLIEQVAKAFGSQCVVVSIDARKKQNNEYGIFSHGGRIEENRTLEQWVTEIQARGAGEILINSIDNDGKMNGYDIDLINRVTGISKIPVICAGGAGELSHFAPAVRAGASAVCCSSIFHYTQVTPMAIKERLSSDSFPVRIN
jgi:cyclase